MSAQDGSDRFEYPDTAGYPDGTGFLDEGTALRQGGATVDAVGDADLPSADRESEVVVHRDDIRHIYAASAGEREIARMQFDEVDGRIVVLTTSVVPEFRGRGIAPELIAYALDDIRDRGMRVTVYCPAVTAFLDENLQFADLIDPDYPGR